MDAIHAELFREVARVYAETKTLPEETLCALSFMFPGNAIVMALSLVEKRHVTYLRAPSGRGAYQVTGSTGTPYVCLASSGYCGCHSYRFGVLRRGTHAMCKHVMAVRLAEAMGLVEMRDVTDSALTDVIRHV